MATESIARDDTSHEPPRPDLTNLADTVGRLQADLEEFEELALALVDRLRLRISGDAVSLAIAEALEERLGRREKINELQAAVDRLTEQEVSHG